MTYCCGNIRALILWMMFSHFWARTWNNPAETALVSLPDTPRGHIMVAMGLDCLRRGMFDKRKFTTLLSNCSISVSLPLFMHHSLHPPTPPPLAGDLSEPSQGGVPRFIVLSDCLLPASVGGVQPHTDTDTRTSQHRTSSGARLIYDCT